MTFANLSYSDFIYKMKINRKNQTIEISKHQIFDIYTDPICKTFVTEDEDFIIYKEELETSIHFGYKNPLTTTEVITSNVMDLSDQLRFFLDEVYNLDYKSQLDSSYESKNHLPAVVGLAIQALFPTSNKVILQLNIITHKLKLDDKFRVSFWNLSEDITEARYNTYYIKPEGGIAALWRPYKNLPKMTNFYFNIVTTLKAVFNYLTPDEQ